jgi:hypothetical protein
VTGLYSLQNGLYTDNPEVRAFLDDKEPNWQKYQTVPPAKMAAAAVSEKAIKLSWTPIDYIYPYNKGYEI